MKITIFGAGYVGLVTAACFADKGNTVTLVDISKDKVSMLERGEVPIFEPGLADLVRNNKKRLHFTTDAEQGVRGTDLIFLAVGTPQKGNSWEADLQYLEAAATTIAKYAENEKIVVVKSTVPVGTASHLKQLMQKHTTHNMILVSNPEFLKEGDAIRDFEFPDRVIVGTNSERAKLIMRDLYEPFFRRSDRLLLMSNESAELAKYGSNIMLASRVSIINELARLAQATGADISHVRQGIGADERIGTSFLYPGPGYGGSCFPKDVREASALGERYGVKLDAIPAIDHANEEHKRFFSHFALSYLQPVSKKTVAVWGVAFKHKTDDIRESAALTLIQALLDSGAHVRLYDPEAMNNAKSVFASRIEYGEQYEILNGADALIIMTDWNEFKNPDFPDMKRRLTKPLIIDGRNLYNLDRMQLEGFDYRCVGRT